MEHSNTENVRNFGRENIGMLLSRFLINHYSITPCTLLRNPYANELIINVTQQETRVALLEDRVLAELYIERTKGRGNHGGISTKGVVKVLPGMQAAFVDIRFGKGRFPRMSRMVSTEN